MRTQRESEKLSISIMMSPATELRQIDKTEDGKNRADRISTIVFKKQKVFAKNSEGAEQVVEIPYFSGNGFRGKMRRVAFKILLEAATKKGIPMPDRYNFHLMENGGASIYTGNDKYETIEKIREINPLISVFGASLAVSGKLITPNFIPYKNVSAGRSPEYYLQEYTDSTGRLRLFSYIDCNEKFVKLDSILDHNGNAKFLDKEEILEWEKDVVANQKAVATTRESKSKKDGDSSVADAKKGTVRSILSGDFIIRGTRFYSNLQEMPSATMTSIERGMVYSVIEKMALTSRFGANISKGFGLMNFKIQIGGEDAIETVVDHTLTPSVERLEYPESVQRDIDAWNEWLNNDFSEESFKVSELLNKSS